MTIGTLAMFVFRLEILLRAEMKMSRIPMAVAVFFMKQMVIVAAVMMFTSQV